VLMFSGIATFLFNILATVVGRGQTTTSSASSMSDRTVTA